MSSKIVDRGDKGSNIGEAENDKNLSSLAGINILSALTSYTVDVDNQNDTIQFSAATAVDVTLDSVATILTALHTDDLKVTIIPTGAGTVTLTCNVLDTFQNGDTTLDLIKGQAITIETNGTGNGWLFKSNNKEIILGTEQATTSGTTINFTSIPAWAKRVNVFFNGVSNGGTGSIAMTIGDSGGLETSGYIFDGTYVDGTQTVTQSSNTTKFDLFPTAKLADGSVIYGAVTLQLMDTNNTWVMTGLLTESQSPDTAYMSGIKSLSGTLTQVTITSGDTFDGGAVNISYE